MVGVSDIDNILNGGRETLLSTISKAPESTGLQSIFWLIAIAMCVIMFLEFRKGYEERKGIYGPFAILLLCLSVIFGFKVMLLAWIIMFVLALLLITKLKRGEWAGVFIILIVLYFLAYLTSVNVPMMIILGGAFTLLAALAKRANFFRTYGTSEAAKIMNEEGYPVKKERKIIRGLAKIAGKGYGWSKDKVLRTQSKIKQRFAEREAHNIEEQEHMAEIAAAGKKLSETVSELEQKQMALEQKDWNYVAEILKTCQQLRSRLNSLGENAVDDQRKQEMMKDSKQILALSNSLVKDKLEEESLLEHSNKILETCMSVIHHASDEAKQLKENRSEFKEIKRAADQNISSLRKEIAKNLHNLARAENEAASSKAEGAKERAKLLDQRKSALNDVEKKLAEINSYTDQIMKRLMRINATEDDQIKQIDRMNDHAEKHGKRVILFERRFKTEDSKLKEEHKKFEHLFKEETAEIPDEQLLNVTDSTILLFDQLVKISDISRSYNEKELMPLIIDMANVTRELYQLSGLSEYLTKMYYRLSQAMEELNKMCQIVDQNPESKKELAKIMQTEDLERQLTKRAYKKGKLIISNISDSHKHLEQAHGYLGKHIQMLERYGRGIDSARKEVIFSLNDAFKKILNIEIRQAKILETEAARAESELRDAKRAELRAKHAV